VHRRRQGAGRCAQDKGLSEDYIVPTMDEWEVYPRIAAAVGVQAHQDQVARLPEMSFEQLREKATAIIKEARDRFDYLQRSSSTTRTPEP